MKLISTETFKKNAPFALPENTPIAKQYIAEIKALEDHQIKFTISTSNPDRHQDTVDAKGWETDNFMANPVVLFGHNYDALPIGKCISLKREGGSLVAVAQFATPDLNPMGDQVYRMLKAGFLNATSVGFIPKEYSATEDESRPYGYDFTKQELLEFSVVPVPANAECLQRAKELGIDLGVIRGWAEKAIQTCKDADERAALITLADTATKAALAEGSTKTTDPAPAPKSDDPAASVQVETPAEKEATAMKELILGLAADIKSLRDEVAAIKAAPAPAAPAPIETKTEATAEADEYTAEEVDMLVKSALEQFEYRFTGRVAN